MDAGLGQELSYTWDADAVVPALTLTGAKCTAAGRGRFARARRASTEYLRRTACTAQAARLNSMFPTSETSYDSCCKSADLSGH
jgi:hypothetical protein